MDAYDRLNAINEALISIDEKRTVMGRIARLAQTVGANIRKATRSGTVFTPRGAQTRGSYGQVRMPDDVVASKQPTETLGFRGGAESRIRGERKSVKQAVRRAGGVVTSRSGAGSAGTLDMATGRAREGTSRSGVDPLDVKRVANIQKTGKRAGRLGRGASETGVVVGTTDKMTPREKLKTLRAMRKNRDAANYQRGAGDRFKKDAMRLKSDMESSLFPQKMTRKDLKNMAQRGADRIRLGMSTRL